MLRFHDGMAVVSEEVVEVASARPFSLLFGVWFASRMKMAEERTLIVPGLSIVSVAVSDSLNKVRRIELCLDSSSGEGSGEEVYDVASVSAGESEVGLANCASVTTSTSVIVDGSIF